MSELNSIPSTTPIPDDTRLVGQRPANQGGAAVAMSIAELVAKILGGSSGTFSIDTLIARKALQGIPATNGVDEFIGLHPYIEGAPVFAHTVDLWAGIPNRFASAADHAHYKMAIRNAAGPGAGSAGERAQMMYTANPAGTSSLNIHGYEAEIATTELQSEHSIDTTATTVAGSPSFLGTIKVRHTVSHGLSLNQRVLFRVTSAVAGIQASFFSATVTQAPTLVSGQYETLLQVACLDTNHWDPAKAANTTAQNADWRVLTLTAGEVNSAGKVAIARDTTGPTDQLLVTWSSAHGLAYGANVVLWTDGALTGLTGLFLGFHSGFVAEVVSTTQVRIRIRNQRSQTLRSLSGTATSAVSTWSVFPGTMDPHHEPQQPANIVAGQRDATGRTRRLMLGDADVIVDDEWAIGAGGPSNTLRGRGGDLRIGGQSLRTMAGSKAPNGGVRVIRDHSTAGGVNTPLALGSVGTSIGAGPFTIAAHLQVDAAGAHFFMLGDTAAFWGLLANSNGDLVLETWDGTTITSTTVAASAATQPLIGTVGTVAVVRSTTDIAVWINGTEFYRGTPASWNRPLTSAALLRIGGGFVAANRYNAAIYRSWMFTHTITADDLAFLAAHGRLPTALNGALTTPNYSSDFSAGTDSWTPTAVTLTGNIDSIGGQDNALRVVVDSSTGSHIVARAGVLPRGKRIRISADFYRPASNSVVTGVVSQHFNQFNGPQTQADRTTQLPTDTWTTVTIDIEDLGHPSSGTALIWYLCNASGGISFAGNGTDILYLRNVQVQRLGAFLDLDFGVGVGGQVHDLSGNGLHATLVAPYEHVVPVRSGQVRHRVSASGNTQIPAGIPPNARIRWVTANAAGSVTLSLGNVSAGTQIVNAQTLSAGRQDVGANGAFSSTGALWVNLSSAVQVDLTIHFELAD